MAVICPFAEVVKSKLHSHTLLLQYILILSSRVHLYLPSDLFPSSFFTNILCAFLACTIQSITSSLKARQCTVRLCLILSQAHLWLFVLTHSNPTKDYNTNNVRTPASIHDTSHFMLNCRSVTLMINLTTRDNKICCLVSPPHKRAWHLRFLYGLIVAVLHFWNPFPIPFYAIKEILYIWMHM